MELQLYEIEQEYVTLIETIIENGGEVSEVISLALDINQKNLETKGLNYGFVVKQLKSEVDVIDAEIDRLSSLKVSRNKTIDYLKEKLSNAMELYEIDKIESPIIKINFRKSESVEIDDVKLLDAKFIVIKTTESPDKVAIKKAIKEGEEVAGAVLKQNKNLQIK